MSIRAGVFDGPLQDARTRYDPGASLEFREETERKAAETVRELGLTAAPGQAGSVFMGFDGFEMTAEDEAEWQRPLQIVAYYLIGETV